MKATHRLQTTKATRKTASVLEALEQRIAPAGIFKWNAAGGGSWTNPANWTLLSGSAGAGYPDAQDDEAQLTNSITANSTITIPDNTEISLGKLRFDDNNNYTVASAGTGRLVIDGEGSILVTSVNGSATHTITAPVGLRANAEFDNDSASTLVIQGAITELFGFLGVEKSGSGIVTFSGAMANSYTGNTTVLDGTLRLAKSSGVTAIGSGSLLIGVENGSANPVVALLANEQIPNTQLLKIERGGSLDLGNATETLEGVLLVDDASVTAATGTLIVKVVGAYSFDGVSTASVGGKLRLVGPAEVVVYNEYQDARLNISAIIDGSNGLRKSGAGVLELSTQEPQLYSGITRVVDGMLLLNTGTSDAGISDDIVIENEGTLRVVNTFEIPDTATISVLGGRFEVAATEDCKNLILDGGTVHIEGGGIFALRPDGAVTVPTNFSSQGSVIEGGGKFRINDNPAVFTIGETASVSDLTISAAMVGLQADAALTKTGLGRLSLTADGSFAGGININAGTVFIDGVQASVVNLAGGTLLNGEFTKATVGGIVSTGGRLVPGYYTEIAGNVILGEGTVFAPRVDYYAGNLKITGMVLVADATLDLSTVQLPPNNATFLIIENDGTDPVLGGFAGLPEGATVQTPGGNFKISYVGGSGNDVSLTPVFATPTILANGKAATYVDSDGDLVTVRVSKGTLSTSNFTLLASGLGAELQELKLSGADFEGASLTITAKAKNGVGNRMVNVGYLNALVDFSTISIAGDVGRFGIGSAATPTPAFQSLSVISIGASAPVSTLGSSYISEVNGNFGTLKVKRDIIGANVQVKNVGSTAGNVMVGGSVLAGDSNGVVGLSVFGGLNKMTIAGDFVGAAGGANIRVNGGIGKFVLGGSVFGGSGFQAGTITLSGGAGAVTIGGDLIGGSGNSSAALKIVGMAGSVKVGGSIFGGDGVASGALSFGGDVQSVQIGRDLRGGWGSDSGSVVVEGRASAVKIGGSLLGGAAGSGFFAQTFGKIAIGRDVAGTLLGRAAIGAAANPNPADDASALAIASIAVGRNVSQADLFAGYDRALSSPIEADAQIGKVSVKGNWHAARLLAGVDSVDGVFANGDDQPVAGGSFGIASRIASIVIGGSVTGTVTSGDRYGFEAEEILALSVSGKKVPLTSDGNDVVAFGSFGDVQAREI